MSGMVVQSRSQTIQALRGFQTASCCRVSWNGFLMTVLSQSWTSPASPAVGYCRARWNCFASNWQEMVRAPSMSYCAQIQTSMVCRDCYLTTRKPTARNHTATSENWSTQVDPRQGVASRHVVKSSCFV